MLGAYLDERLCGIVHYLFHRSCWTTGDYCYLQDLFVAEGARNLGLGRALILAVEDRARAAGASRIYWLTHETNADARVLYDRLAERPGFIQYRKLFESDSTRSKMTIALTAAIGPTRRVFLGVERSALWPRLARSARRARRRPCARDCATPR